MSKPSVPTPKPRTNFARQIEGNAALDRAARILARRNLIDFVTYTNPAYKAEHAHQLIAAHLDAVLRGEVKRLMIIAPPQHGKSELATVRFPVYWLANRPNDPIIMTSYAASLAEAKSREARGIFESSAFAKLYPDVRTDPQSRSVSFWNVQVRQRGRWETARGRVVAAGVGGPITGHGALLGIIDDPFENWRQAQSKTIRDLIWNWYRATFLTRIWEDGAIVIISTRWHEDDLIGRILRDETDDWVVLRLPALAETDEERARSAERLGIHEDGDPLGRKPEEALCPKRFSAEHLRKLRRRLGDLMWSAIYQGAPVSPKGVIFRREWLQYVSSVPPDARHVRYWDKASSIGERADYTAGVRMAVDNEGRYYIVDVVRGRWTPHQRNRVMREVAEADGIDVPIRFEQEGGAGGKESAIITQRWLEGYNALAVSPSGQGGKEIRAQALASLFEAGQVYILRGSWNEMFINELLAFPQGRHDDQVDAAVGALYALIAGQRGRNYLTYMRQELKEMGKDVDNLDGLVWDLMGVRR